MVDAEGLAVELAGEAIKRLLMITVPGSSFVLPLRNSISVGTSKIMSFVFQSCIVWPLAHMNLAIYLAFFFIGFFILFFTAIIGMTMLQLSGVVDLAADPGQEEVQAALRVNVLFIIGAILAPVLAWGFRTTRAGIVVRVVGESNDAARALGIRPNRVRVAATATGGALAGVGGAYLSLFYPGSWNEGISSGQGLIAVALVIFARWSPINCFFAALLFGGAGALGPALQSVGITEGYYLWFAAPYVLTLGVLIASSSKSGTMAGAPRELSITK